MERLKIIGDAGTGKTTTIINYAKTYQAVVVSHTRGAVNAIKKRENIECSTLHSFALRFPTFREYSIKSLKIGIENIRREFCRLKGIPYSLDPYVTLKGNNLFTKYGKIVNTNYPDEPACEREVMNFLVDYESFKLKHKLIDYEDMLKYLYDLAENGEFSIERIIVDEAQDLSPLQYRIISKASKFIISAGDEFQSIFSFHGAEPEIFKNFSTSKCILLEKNYRIRQNIWFFTEHIIKKQLTRKRAIAVKEGGIVQVTPPMSLQELSRFVNGLKTPMVLLRYNEDVVALKKMCSEKIKIDTIHALKGHESSTVVLVDGVKENKLDDEEYRVWYVGATRAKDQLIIVPLKGRKPVLRDIYDQAEFCSPKKVMETNTEINRETLCYC